jgi:hypothetical protein
MSQIRFEWAGHPPSVNNIYFTRGRKRILTAEARAFKNAFVLSRGGLSFQELNNFVAFPDKEYELTLWFYFPREALYNKSYGKRKGTAKFKKMDASNLVKLVEDAISELLGLEDRNNFTVITHKRVAPEPSLVGLVATLQPLDLENDPYGLP